VIFENITFQTSNKRHTNSPLMNDLKRPISMGISNNPLLRAFEVLFRDFPTRAASFAPGAPKAAIPLSSFLSNLLAAEQHNQSKGEA
jgi:hypothetical protein